MLTPVESFWLRWHIDHGSATVRRQARIVLASLDRPPDAIAVDLQLSPAAVARILERFEQDRLDIFPRPALFTDELLEAAQVDMAHAQQVAANALRLFDLSQAVHGLPARLRPFLETAALLHNVALDLDGPQHHTAGRDLVMAVNLVGHTQIEKVMLACLIRFHRKAVRPRKEPLLKTLTARQQREVLAASALLRIADGLDYSQSQTTQIEGLALTPETITLVVSGPHAEADGERAVQKADLWTKLFESDWVVGSPPPDFASIAQIPLAPATPTSTAAVRALADQYTRWQAGEAEARAGAPLAIKAVRAAARRARAALELFRPYFKKKPVKGLRRQLKQAEDALALVRDWDVLIEQADKEATGEAWPFLENWKRQRQEALTQAATWLAGDDAKALCSALAAFIAEPPIKRNVAAPLADDAGPILLAPLEALSEYAAALDDADLRTYHDLRRLAVKRCRFALEFLAPALGGPAQVILKELVRAQDRLGYLNDACVAQTRLDAWLAEVPADEGARRYRLRCASQIQKHLRKFKRDWEPVRPEMLRHKFGTLLGQLIEEPWQASKGEADEQPV